MEYPKISIITPVFNQADFIEQTISSVINQNYPGIEYIIVDGGSTDGTVDILKRYENKISKLIIEADKGMYDALHKGFSHSTGEIMAWINADDIFLPNSFQNMMRLFNDLPQVEWIQGLNSFIDLEGNLIFTQPAKKFSLVTFLNRDFKWVQQESTFWRRSLWEKAGAGMNKNLKYAGDFELWLRFFNYAKLYNTSIPIGAWRQRAGQLSGTFMNQYLREAEALIQEYENTDETLNEKLESLQKQTNKIGILKKLKILNTDFLERKRNKLKNIERIEINYSYKKQKFVI